MSLASLIKRCPNLTAAYYLYNDWQTGRRWAKGQLGTASGSRHAKLGLDESLAYIEKVTTDYFRYADRSRFTGAVAEIGPGDNFGVALRILGQGATVVHAVDKFKSFRDPHRQTLIYQALAEQHGLTHIFNGAPSEATLRGLVYHSGSPAEIFFRTAGLNFDAVLSRAVLEHLADPLMALDDMIKTLSPGGIMVHRIDFRDHGMFAGSHPLTFLTFSKEWWRRMTQHSGRPNRVLFPIWQQWLARSGLRGSLKITRLVGVKEEVGPAIWTDLPQILREQSLQTVRQIRPKLARAFQGLSDEDLAIAGCVLVVEVPT